MRNAIVRVLVLLHVAAGGVLAAPAPAVETKDPAAMEILRRANAAAEAAPGVTYDFEYIGGGVAAGRFTGSAKLLKGSGSGLGGAAYWADTRMRTRPLGYEEFPSDFLLASDGEMVFALDREKRILETGSVKAGANHLRRTAVFAVLFQFLQPRPFQREIDMSEQVSSEGTARVGETECNRVRVVYKPEAGGGEARWCFGVEDHLPRKQVSVSVINGHLSYFEFTMNRLQVDGSLSREAFRLQPPAGFRVEDSDGRAVQVGALAPDWELKSASGKPVRLSGLRNQVVVMDFWVTWCPICRVLMPEVQKLHQDYTGKPVKVLGINVWEPGDPAQHMKKNGYSYELLLDGEPVADLYKIFWQPAMFVIGADGKILYADNGRDGERDRHVREAIDAELARMGQPK